MGMGDMIINIMLAMIYVLLLIPFCAIIGTYIGG